MTKADLVAVESIPEQFDWRNVNGKNYVSPVRNQATCGSCYAFGTLAMFEARVRILTNNTWTPVFSTQDIVSCSEYSQGCEGGESYYLFSQVCRGCWMEDVAQRSCIEEICRIIHMKCLLAYNSW